MGAHISIHKKLALALVGKKAFALTMISILVGGLALTMAMLIFVGELLVPAFTRREIGDETWEFRITCIVVAFAGMLPLSLVKSWKDLRFTSFFATLSIGYIVLFVTVGSLSYRDVKHHHRERGKAVILSTNILTTFAMLINSFACQLQTVPIYSSMSNRHPANGIRAVFLSLLITTVVYTLVGILGYLHFGQNVEENVLDSFWHTHETSIFLQVANFSIALTLIFHLPLAVWPWRSATVALLRIARGAGVEGIVDTKATNREWVLVTIGLTVLTLICAILIPSIKIALSICGCWSGAFIVFILPFLFNYYSDKDSRKSPMPWLLLTFGIAACGVSLWHVITQIIDGKM